MATLQGEEIIMLLKGSCHCGAVKFSVRSSTPYPYMRCYCSICRKTAGGGGYAINIMGKAKSLKVKGSGYELRFDPAWLLTGKTANQAALEDTGSSDVPNDSYVVNESTRAYTFLVSANTQVRVLTTGSNLNGTPITVAQLAQLAAGKNPFPKTLFEPISTGFWITIRNDKVESLEQQYHP